MISFHYLHISPTSTSSWTQTRMLYMAIQNMPNGVSIELIGFVGFIFIRRMRRKTQCDCEIIYARCTL